MIQKPERACLIALLLASAINDISSNFNERLDRCDDNPVLAHLFIAIFKMVFVCNETGLRIKYGSSFSGTFNTQHNHMVTFYFSHLNSNFKMITISEAWPRGNSYK